MTGSCRLRAVPFGIGLCSAPCAALCLALGLLLVTAPAEGRGQGLGPVTGIELSGSTLTLHAGADLVVFKACAENILMLNYRPGGIKDPDTLVVGRTRWPAVAAQIDTSGDPITLSTSFYLLEVDRSPLRMHLTGKMSSIGPVRLDEPAGGGINQNTITLSTLGGTYYGLHNRASGTLSTPTGGAVSAGSQGQAGGPFIWNTQGWGFLADADGGFMTIVPDGFEFQQPASPSKRDLACYFFVGWPKQIIAAMHEVSGFPPLFPKYALGFLNTEWGIDQAELYSDLRTYRQKQTPIDAYALDFDWMDWGADNYGEFRWGPKFPDGQSGAIVDTLRRYNMHLMGIRKPRVHVNTVQGQYAESQGYFVDHVQDYFSKRTVGRLNFHNPAVRSWYWNSFALQGGTYDKGITSYWNDEADEYGGNLMFMQMERAMYEGQRSYTNNRVWSINRNFYTGAQRYAYGLWSGDINTGFQVMADQRLFMLTSVNVGASWWGMDIGGFKTDPIPENYYRWVQFGAFVPLFRVHGALNLEREPWYFGAQADSIATRYIRLRYRLMPYIYAHAWENHLTGVSIVRPLVMEYPHDPAVAELASEWLFGSSLLVSPVVQQGAAQQSVYLPQGAWYDFQTGAKYTGGQSYTVPVTPADIPLFVKGGSIIPMSPPAQYTDAPEMKALVLLDSYPGGTGECTVYDDDGLTYDYEKGSYCTTKILHDRTSERTVISIAARTGAYEPPRRDWLCEVNWLTGRPDSVLLDGQPLAQRPVDSLYDASMLYGPSAGPSVTGWAFDAAARRCSVRLPDDGKAHQVAVYTGSASMGMSGEGASPYEYSLGQNFPNPFNPATTILYTVPYRTGVTLAVFNTLGQEVAELVRGEVEPGRHEIHFDASGLASGVYFYTLQARSFRQSRKLVVLR